MSLAWNERNNIVLEKKTKPFRKDYWTTFLDRLRGEKNGQGFYQEVLSICDIPYASKTYFPVWLNE